MINPYELGKKTIQENPKSKEDKESELYLLPSPLDYHESLQTRKQHELKFEIEQLKANRVQVLDLSGTIFSVEQVLWLSRALESNSSLTSLNLRGCSYFSQYKTATEVIIVQCLTNILNATVKHKSLKILNLSENQIDSKMVQVICKIFGTQHSIQELNLSRNKITREGIVLISSLLKSDSTLHSLDLSYNSLSSIPYVQKTTCTQEESEYRLKFGRDKLVELDKTIEKEIFDSTVLISQALQVNTSLKILKLNGLNIYNNALMPINFALISNQRSGLQILELAGNRINGWFPPRESLQYKLQEINLSGNCFEGTGISSFAKTLPNFPSLKTLKLSNNPLRDEGIHALTLALMSSSVHTLILSEDPDLVFGDETSRSKSFTFIGQMLTKNKHLQILEITGAGGELDGSCLLPLAAGLKANKTLRTLNLSFWNINEGDAEIIANYLIDKNCVLETLYLDGSFSFEHRGAAIIAESLRMNSSLTYIKFLDARDVGAITTVAHALKINKRIQKIELCLSSDNVELATVIAEMLLKNTTLKTLTLTFPNPSPKSMQLIIKALNFNSTLETLRLKLCSEISDYNCKGFHLANSLNDLLKTNHTLRNILLDNTGNGQIDQAEMSFMHELTPSLKPSTEEGLQKITIKSGKKRRRSVFEADFGKEKKTESESLFEMDSGKEKKKESESFEMSSSKGQGSGSAQDTGSEKTKEKPLEPPPEKKARKEGFASAQPFVPQFLAFERSLEPANRQPTSSQTSKATQAVRFL